MRAWAAVTLVVLALALACQGARGLADPDEGFYSNVAVGMVESGDWWVPRLNGQVFLDKPPLLYWGIALGVDLFGRSELAARAAQALWFAATALVVGLIARELWGPRHGPPAAMAYGMTAGPFAAANVLTPDTPLVFWSVLAVFAFLKQGDGQGSGQEWRWTLLLGVALGCGALAKGPAILLTGLPLLAWRAHRSGWRSLLSARVTVPGLVAVAIAAAWYASVALRVPGAATYWFDSQIAGRLWSDSYDRNSRWWQGLEVYAPALLLGSLPWTPLLLVRGLRRLRHPRRAGATSRFLLTWLVLPLAVLLIARSRLPLYVLPVLPPLVLFAVRSLIPRSGAWRPSRRLGVLLAIWIIGLISFKLEAARWPTYKDTRRVARGLASAGIPPSTPTLVVDSKLNALRFYGFETLRNARYWEADYPYFVHWPHLARISSLGQRAGHIAVVSKWPETLLLRNELRETGLSCSRARLGPTFGVLDCRTAEADARRQ